MKTIIILAAAIALLAGCSKPAAPAPAAVAADPTRWEYTLVKIEPLGGRYWTYLTFYPSTNRWPVGDCADVLNQVRDHGWQEAWISADGLQVLVKRPAGSPGTGAIIPIDDLKPERPASP
jgi:hypothetical protein